MHLISTYLDIIIFAVIALVLLFRLRSVLGQRSDQDPPGLSLPPKMQKDDKAEKGAENGPEKPGALPLPGGVSPLRANTPVPGRSKTGQSENPMERWAQNLPNFQYVSNATTHNTLIQFPSLDPSFRPDDFLEKARKAYVMVVQAFSEGNKNALDYLLSPKLKQVFDNQIDARDTGKEYYHTQFHGITGAIISDASLDGSVARVTVDFVAEQTTTRKDADGAFIPPFDGRRQTTRDRWVFVRDLKSASPAWLLENTLPMDD